MKNIYFLVVIFLLLNLSYISAQNIPQTQNLDKHEIDKAIKEIKEFEKLVNKDKIEFQQPLIKDAVLKDLREAKNYIADLKEFNEKGNISEKDKMFTVEVINKLNIIKTTSDTLSIQETNELQITLTPECANNNSDFKVKFVTRRGGKEVEGTYVIYTKPWHSKTSGEFNGSNFASFLSTLPVIDSWFWAQSIDGSLKSCPRTLKRSCTAPKVEVFDLLDSQELQKAPCKSFQFS